MSRPSRYQIRMLDEGAYEEFRLAALKEFDDSSRSRKELARAAGWSHQSSLFSSRKALENGHFSPETIARWVQMFPRLANKVPGSAPRSVGQAPAPPPSTAPKHDPDDMDSPVNENLLRNLHRKCHLLEKRVDALEAVTKQQEQLDDPAKEASRRAHQNVREMMQAPPAKVVQDTSQAKVLKRQLIFMADMAKLCAMKLVEDFLRTAAAEL